MTMCECVRSLSVRYSWVFVDSHPDRRSIVADRMVSRLKALGDKSRVPCLQNMGMYVHVSPANTEPDVFVRLAKGYVVPDRLTKKKEVCALNAEASARRSYQPSTLVNFVLSF